MRYVDHKKGRDWTPIIQRKLWSDQVKALDLVARYFDSASTKQALVRMPTGTGKTAVISVIAQLALDFPRVLVVAPWKHLVDQLRREIGQAFWEKSKLTDTFSLRPVASFTPIALAALLAQHSQAGVLLCTNQTLERLNATEGSLFDELRNWTTVALVDEGHREPEAEQKSIIRSVNFVTEDWPRTGPDAVSTFVTRLIEFRNTLAKKKLWDRGNIRVIVRCETHDEVDLVTQHLINAGEKALGVHEQFKSRNEPYLRKSVPDPVQTDAVFWVHQYKLMEGLDDSRFRIVAVFGPFVNARNLVQQVGRVIRNPDHQEGEEAFVFVRRSDQQLEFWKRFIGYEKSVQDRIKQGQTEISTAEALREIRSNAGSFYFLGDFRKQLAPDEIDDPRGFVRLRRSVQVLQLKPGLKFGALVAGIEKDVVARDGEFFGSAFESEDTYLRIYEVFEDSPMLEELYLGNRLAYVFARQVKDLLFFADSERTLPDFLTKNCAPIPQEQLRKLFPDKASVIREISLLNGDPGNHAFRRRTLGTDSLEFVPPGLSDYIHICSTAVGKVEGEEGSGRRYVGFTKARVTERDANWITFDELSDWIDSLATTVEDEDTTGDETLDRFAVSAEYDGTSPIRHILLDIDVEAINFKQFLTADLDADEEELWKVSNGKFIGRLDDHFFEANITYDKKRKIFLIGSEALATALIEDPDSGKIKPLVGYLNESQKFRAVLENGKIYAQGRFFAPNIRLWGAGRKRVELLNIIVGVPGLENARSEKGDNTYRADGWPPDSVFGVITDFSPAGLFATSGWLPDLVVCNDIGAPEIADFFALSGQPKRLVMIHGKSADLDASLSASAFHEVCSQAVRYLGFFNPNDNGSKLSLDQITRRWRLSGRNCERVIRNTLGLDTLAIRDQIDSMIRDALCTREVWIAMGGGLSRVALQGAVTAGRLPAAHVLHLLYLLQSTWAAVASVGANLRIFCKR